MIRMKQQLSRITDTKEASGKVTEEYNLEITFTISFGSFTLKNDEA